MIAELQPSLSAVAIPSVEDLAPLYAAAKVYGEASVLTSTAYREGRKTHGDAANKLPAVVALSKTRDAAYRAMNVVREAVNANYPGLGLICAAGFVGWTGELASYEKYVRGHLVDFMRSEWRKQNTEFLFELRKLVHAIMPLTAAELSVGDVVYSENPATVATVTKISPKRTKVEARHQLNGSDLVLKNRAKIYRPLPKSAAHAMIAYAQAEQSLLTAAGYKLDDQQ